MKFETTEDFMSWVADQSKPRRFDRLNQLYWRIRHPLRTVDDWRYSAKGTYQRARRGYCDADLWNLDHTLALLIVAGTERLQKGIAYPGTGMTFEEWHAILAQIEKGFRNRLTLHEMDYPRDDWHWPPTPEEDAEFAAAFDLLKEHFWSLWD